MRSCVNTQVASKESVLRGNANRTAASQKHLSAQCVPQNSGPVSMLQQISSNQQKRTSPDIPMIHSNEMVILAPITHDVHNLVDKAMDFGP